MSVANTRACRKRIKMLQRKGHAPKKSRNSVADSVERGRVARNRQTAMGAKK